MTIKQYNGSCHCGAVRFEAAIDLAAGSGKCNCTFCAKVRNWSVHIKPEALTVLAGEQDLSDYRRTANDVHHLFCKHCGVRTFSRGYLEQIGGAYVSVNLASLDNATLEELVATPVKFMDGRHDNWWNAPAETRHL